MSHYTIDGIRFPRVTSILRVINKPTLQAWRDKIGADEADRISRQATTLGKRVHSACEALNLSRPLPADEDLAPFIAAYRTWLEDDVDEILFAERLVYHRTDRYAGQFDVVARMRDKSLALVDLKSSNSISEDYALQTFAYKDALRDMGEPVDRRLVVQLPSRNPGALAVVEYTNDDEDRAAWAACLELHRFMAAHRDDWKRLGIYVKREANEGADTDARTRGEVG